MAGERIGGRNREAAEVTKKRKKKRLEKKKEKHTYVYIYTRISCGVLHARICMPSVRSKFEGGVGILSIGSPSE